MSVGLLVVRLLYRFYVVGHLSQWFTFSVYVSRFVVVVSSFTLAGNLLITLPKVYQANTLCCNSITFSVHINLE